MKKKADVLHIIEELKIRYPDGICSLDYPKDYELLFSVRLAAQCTDERVNLVTPALFARFPTLESLASADVTEVEEYIHSTGFFRAKARDIVAASRMLLEEYGGRVPDTMEDLLRLPGVGRKTANLILGDIYHKPGVVVADTHCIRISGKLGLTDGTKDPGKVEQQLRAILPPEESNDFCHRLVLHGRAVCMARKPDCPNCTLRPWCDFFRKEGA
ncbi:MULTISPECIES: endonuclease III [Intestinimonas]|jgi:endonuclease-3|uniref:Endonuclease III n=1 Tax=Intestinimonas massiliensis (ex Afouda et al. 2020) TaxID=1673721 RepID=A0ABS9M723_9FIRM|nr:MULTISPECIES: endonuclease III [Intestinimonas]MBS6282911.1 endonuclease III [Oscillospiraceae bacterium]CUQ23084.1 endonuclease III [Flavonifractor plautii]SCI83105.1 UV-endonuclease [uncultured Flavonifractor sp.]MCG4526184.1 endonuclease III [Intestinimonas massiliensis (ex Afouda et al. 2020)]MCI5563713.1 endonuclease III [Intestinimonas massiliensis (ex Afouda et al. 2020)]